MSFRNFIWWRIEKFEKHVCVYQGKVALCIVTVQHLHLYVMFALISEWKAPTDLRRTLNLVTMKHCGPTLSWADPEPEWSVTLLFYTLFNPNEKSRKTISLPSFCFEVYFYVQRRLDSWSRWFLDMMKMLVILLLMSTRITSKLF